MRCFQKIFFENSDKVVIEKSVATVREEINENKIKKYKLTINRIVYLIPLVDVFIVIPFISSRYMCLN